MRPRLLPQIAFVVLALAGAVQAASAAWIPAKAVLAQVLLERAFERSLVSGEAERPWPWADMVPLARIAAPRLGEQAIVLSGASGQAMAFGPTELPTRTGGAVRVLAAHRDTHFAFVRHLRPGDLLTRASVDGTQARYRVERFETVRWDAFAIPQNPHGEWLALSTCFPFETQERGPLRRVVWARRLDDNA